MDILLENDNDLRIHDGDFIVGGADLHHVEAILVSVPGSFKQSPLLGANVRGLLNGKLDVAARRDIRLQMASDDYKAKNLSIDSEGTMVVEI